LTCARILGRDLNCLPNQSRTTNVTPTESLTDISGVPFTWSHAKALRPSRFWEEAQGVWHATWSWCASVGCWNPITLFGKLVRNGCAAELVVIDKFGDCRVVTAHRTLLVAPELQGAELHGQGIE